MLQHHIFRRLTFPAAHYPTLKVITQMLIATNDSLEYVTPVCVKRQWHITHALNSKVSKCDLLTSAHLKSSARVPGILKIQSLITNIWSCVYSTTCWTIRILTFPSCPRWLWVPDCWKPWQWQMTLWQHAACLSKKTSTQTINYRSVVGKLILEI